MINRKPNLPILLSLLAMLAMGLLVSGCSDDSAGPIAESSTGSDQYEGLDFSQEFGGLTISDEPEAFADEALLALMHAEDEELVEDPLALDPEVLRWEEMGGDPSDPNDPTRPRFTFLKLRWGMIHGPDDTLAVKDESCDPVDWTGEFHTDRGLVIVRRVIAFERPSDHLIFPRLDRKTVAFVSRTGCHFDGLLVQIIEPPEDTGDKDGEPNMLHINTGPYAGQYNVADLAEINEMIDVDEAGNRFQLTGFTLSDINYCPKGFLSGRYRVLPADDSADLALDEDDPAGRQLGKFSGLWTDLTGRIHGFLRGGYGLDAEGNRVFVGKYIDRRGHFKGRLRGTWEPAEEDDSLATFGGHWVGRGGEVDGFLRGRAHPVEGYPGGFFEGRWTTACDDEAEDLVF